MKKVTGEQIVKLERRNPTTVHFGKPDKNRKKKKRYRKTTLVRTRNEIDGIGRVLQGNSSRTGIKN